MTQINTIFNSTKGKIAYVDNAPKMFLEVDENELKDLPIKEGTARVGLNEVVLGYEEAQMMKKEGLFTAVGDTIPNFFGLPSVRVVGILKPTGTAIDSYHLMSSETLKNIAGQATVHYQASQFEVQ